MEIKHDAQRREQLASLKTNIDGTIARAARAKSDAVLDPILKELKALREQQQAVEGEISSR